MNDELIKNLGEIFLIIEHTLIVVVLILAVILLTAYIVRLVINMFK